MVFGLARERRPPQKSTRESMQGQVILAVFSFLSRQCGKMDNCQVVHIPREQYIAYPQMSAAPSSEGCKCDSNDLSLRMYKTKERVCAQSSVIAFLATVSIRIDPAKDLRPFYNFLLSSIRPNKSQTGDSSYRKTTCE